MPARRIALRVALLATACWFSVSLAAAQPLLPPRAGDTTPDPGSTAPANERSEPGYLGVVADDGAEAGRGIRVNEVVKGGPAEASGLQAGDLITQIGERVVRNMDDLGAALGPQAAGTKLSFTVERGGKTVIVPVTLGTRPGEGERRFPKFGRVEETLPEPKEGEGTPRTLRPDEARPAQPRATVTRRAALGVRTQPIDDEVRSRLGLRSNVGALVIARNVGSPAEKAGIPLGAVLIAANGEPINRPEDLAAIVGQGNPGDKLEITFIARGATSRVTAELGDASAVAAAPSDGAGGGASRPGLSPPGLRPLPSSPSAPGPGRIGDDPRTQGPLERLDNLERRLDAIERKLNEILKIREEPPKKLEDSRT